MFPDVLQRFQLDPLDLRFFSVLMRFSLRKRLAPRLRDRRESPLEKRVLRFFAAATDSTDLKMLYTFIRICSKFASSFLSSAQSAFFRTAHAAIWLSSHAASVVAFITKTSKLISTIAIISLQN